MLALPFFLFNLKIAFIVFSPYYKCKTCSLTKRKKIISRDRQKEECTCKPSSRDASSRPHFQTLFHTWHMYKHAHTHTHVCMSIMIQPCQDWDVAQCTACLAFVGPGLHPHSHRTGIPSCRLPKPSPVQALALNPCHVVAHSAPTATRR